MLLEQACQRKSCKEMTGSGKIRSVHFKIDATRLIRRLRDSETNALRAQLLSSDSRSKFALDGCKGSGIRGQGSGVSKRLEIHAISYPLPTLLLFRSNLELLSHQFRQCKPGASVSGIAGRQIPLTAWNAQPVLRSGKRSQQNIAAVAQNFERRPRSKLMRASFTLS
jgi:hypothetical protein